MGKKGWGVSLALCLCCCVPRLGHRKSPAETLASPCDLFQTVLELREGVPGCDFWDVCVDVAVLLVRVREAISDSVFA